MRDYDRPNTPRTREFGRLVVSTNTDAAAPPPGTHKLELDEAGEALFHVPARRQTDAPAPLLVMLHGAGGTAEHSLSVLRVPTDEAGVLLLAPSSRDSTWDLLTGGWGHDVALIERALDEVLGRYDVDRLRVGIGGFSDGASYALSLGYTNGDLFSHILAFSPGFMAPAVMEDRPACFISHGTDDRVLPVDRCSRRLVPALRAAGYEVRYDEFEGGHEVPRPIVADALDWFLARD